MTTFALLLAVICGADELQPVEAVAPEAPPPPARLVYYGASLGTFINSRGGVASLRVSVEPSIFRRPLNEFTVLVELGAGLGFAMGDGDYTQHYNYSAIAGMAYRSDHSTWEWGFRLGLGADWYRTTLDPSQPYTHFQQQVTGYVEGRGQLGLIFSPQVRAGLFLGYGSPFVYDPLRPGGFLVGGVHAGLYLSLR